MPSLWMPCTQMQHLEYFPPLAITHGKGSYLYDQDNNSYLDAISSWWVNLHGHCHPFINSAIKQQLETLEHTLLAGVLHPQIQTLADNLVSLAPKGLTKAFFADSGSAAIECALKMSLQSWHQGGFTKKNIFVSLEHGYHGETLGSLAVTDIPLFSKQFAPLLIKHLRAPSPADIFRPHDTDQQSHEHNALRALEKIFSENHDNICAFICEPLVQGACGMGMYSADYLKKAKALCEHYQIHFIADEIAVGFGRTGTLFACEQAEITPDFMCLSKGLTAGYLPMSCVLTTEEVYQAFLDDDIDTGLAKGFLHSHSFTGNPLAAAAANASLQLFKQKDILTNNSTKIATIKQCLSKLSQNNYITQPRQCGMIAAFTVTHAHPLAKQIQALAVNQGILIRPIGNHIYIMPPYSITTEEIIQLFDAMIVIITSAIENSHQNNDTMPPNLYSKVDPSLLS